MKHLTSVIFFTQEQPAGGVLPAPTHWQDDLLAERGGAARQPIASRRGGATLRLLLLPA